MTSSEQDDVRVERRRRGRAGHAVQRRSRATPRPRPRGAGWPRSPSSSRRTSAPSSCAARAPSFSAGLDRRMLTPDGVPGEESLLTLVARTRRGHGRVHPAGPGGIHLVAPGAADHGRTRPGPRHRCRVPARAGVRLHDRGGRREARHARDLPRPGSRPRRHGRRSCSASATPGRSRSARADASSRRRRPFAWASRWPRCRRRLGRVRRRPPRTDACRDAGRGLRAEAPARTARTQRPTSSPANGPPRCGASRSCDSCMGGG